MKEWYLVIVEFGGVLVIYLMFKKKLCDFSFMGLLFCFDCIIWIMVISERESYILKGINSCGIFDFKLK